MPPSGECCRSSRRGSWSLFVCRSIKRRRRPANGVPGGNASYESPPLITSPSQFIHGFTANLESANAIDSNRSVSRQLLDPARQRSRSVHGSTGEHISASGQVPGKTEIQKHRSVIIIIRESSHQLLGRNA